MQPTRGIAATVLWALVVALLVLPAMHARPALSASGIQVLGAGLALAVLLYGAAAGSGWRLRAILLPLLLVLLVVRLGFWGLVQFSGRGYSVEAMAHLTWESASVAWQAFRSWTVAAFGIVVLLCGLAALWLSRAVRHRPVLPAWLMLPSLLVLIASHAGMPEWQLLQVFQETLRRPGVVVDAVVERRWQASGLVDLHVPAVAQVQAMPAEQPVNLILLYLESVGSALIDHPRWPGLMPNLQAMAQSHSLVDEFHASGFVTIEGIANSQCGTLLPLSGSDGFAQGEGLAAHLPCLGDVLAKAGYQQVYLGGAGMSFAGKGRFLTQHGYDTIKGMEYWRGEMGMEQRPGTWGLSDADLFEQALHELETLHAVGQPFNLTLLTIGTHIPGYRYRECAPWRDDNAFLNAAHCTDQLVQRWIDELHARDLMRDTLLVITADHHVFANPAMRSLFGDAVLDRRLPLIVMGQGADTVAMQARGAAYDLAPTLLDLLGVTHNAGFVLGRSLLRGQARPDYFVRRYHDVQDGQEIAHPDRCTALDGSAPALPLDRCARRELGDLLARIADGYSHQPVAFDCTQPLSVDLPEADTAPSTFMLGAAEQGGNFVWRGRNPPADAKGWFVMLADAQGTVMARQHLPVDQLGANDELPDWWHDPWQDGAARMLVAWRAPMDADGLPAAAVSFAPGWQAHQSSVWLWRMDDDMPMLVDQSAPGETRWRLAPTSCRRLLIN